MARASYFSRIFGNSPVTPLQKHIASEVACVEMLSPYFDAVFSHNRDEAARLQGQIARLENESDAIKNELRMNLPSSLFMPIDRRDALEVLDLHLQDLITNKTKDIAGLILGRKWSQDHCNSWQRHY
jgi:predicted phosphate transport protein (TIGR00153 family)